MFDLTGKTALVTGASGGIGGAIARALHKQGATVTLSGTRAEALEQLKASLGERAHVVTARMDEAADLERLAKEAEAGPAGSLESPRSWASPAIQARPIMPPPRRA